MTFKTARPSQGAGGRRVPEPPVVIGRPNRSNDRTPAEMMRAIARLAEDLERSADSLDHWWAQSVHHLLSVAGDTIVDGRTPRALSPSAPRFAPRSRTIGAHRIAERRPAYRLQDIHPRASNVSGADIVEAIEIFRLALGRQLTDSAEAERDRLHDLTDALNDVFAGAP